MTNVLLDETWYAPVFFRGGPHAGNPDECVLLIRRYRVTEAPSGKRRLTKKSDGLTFTNEDAMNATIRHRDWKELPEEADGNPQFVPDEVLAVAKPAAYA